MLNPSNPSQCFSDVLSPTATAPMIGEGGVKSKAKESGERRARRRRALQEPLLSWLACSSAGCRGSLLCLACGKCVDLTYLGSSIGEASFFRTPCPSPEMEGKLTSHTENLNHRATSLSPHAIETLGPGSWEVGVALQNCGLPPRIYIAPAFKGQRAETQAFGPASLGPLARDMGGLVKTRSWRCQCTYDCGGPALRVTVGTSVRVVTEKTALDAASSQARIDRCLHGRHENVVCNNVAQPLPEATPKKGFLCASTTQHKPETSLRYIGQ